MGWRDVGFFVRGRLSRTLARPLTRRPPPRAPAAPLDDVLRGPLTPVALTRLLEGRTNAAREAAAARWRETRGGPFRRHRCATFEGAGENFVVGVGRGERALVLIAHPDAGPKSP